MTDPTSMRSLAALVDAYEARQAATLRVPGALLVLDYTEAPRALQEAARAVSEARDPWRRESTLREIRSLRAKAKAHDSLARTLEGKSQSVSAAKLRALASQKRARADELDAGLLT